MKRLTAKQQLAKDEGRRTAQMGRPRTDNPYRKDDQYERHRIFDDSWAFTNAVADETAYKDGA